MLKMLKRLSLLFFSIFFSILLIEIGTSTLYKITGNNLFSRNYIRNRLFSENDNDVLGIEANEPFYMQRDILHPYLGFTRNNTIGKNINQFGFHGEEPIKKRSADKVIIGLFGGSVAEILFTESKDILVQKLKKYPEFSNREIEIVSLALSGYKQPQQLIALNYILALGGEFDIVINLDGFNELALPYSENLPSNIYPYYPRLWNLYSQKALDIPTSTKIAKMQNSIQERKNLNIFFSKPILNQSILSLYLWNYLDVQKEKKINKTNTKIQRLLAKIKTSRQTTGPDKNIQNEQQFFQEAAKVWKNSSLQMAKLCQENKIAYFHFLQPNQYFPGSKPLTEEEKKVAFENEDYSYKQAVEKGYNLLVQEGKNLQKEGKNFIDLSMIFKNDNRTIYIDKCCHYNELGYDILISEMAKSLDSHFQTKTRN